MGGFLGHIDGAPAGPDPCGLEHGWVNQLFERDAVFGYYISRSPRLVDYILGNSSILDWLKVTLRDAGLKPLLRAILDMQARGGRDTLSATYQMIEKDVAGKSALLARLADIRANLGKTSRLFDSIAPSPGRRSPLAAQRGLDGKLVTIQGNLIHIGLVGLWNTDITSALAGSGVRWILSDYPPFLLSEDGGGLHDDFVCVVADGDDLDDLERAPPFDPKIGWHPFVEISGFYGSAVSMTHRSPRIDLGYVFHRPPVKPETGLKTLVGANDPTRPPPGHYNLGREADRIALLLITQIMYRHHHMSAANIRGPFRMILDQILDAHRHDLPTRVLHLYK